MHWTDFLPTQTLEIEGCHAVNFVITGTPKVVIITTCAAISDNKVGIMTAVVFLWMFISEACLHLLVDLDLFSVYQFKFSLTHWIWDMNKMADEH